MKLNVQASHQQKFSVNVEPQTLVKDLKLLIIETNKEKEDWKGIEIENIRIIFSGRILKDNETMESSKLVEDCTVHIVKSGGSKKIESTNLQSTPSNPSQSTNQQLPSAAAASATNPGATPFVTNSTTIESLLHSMSAGGGRNNAGSGASLASDPSAEFNPMDSQFRLQALQMLSQNPELLRTFLESSPFVQQIPPELRPHLSNPAFLQQISQLLMTMSPEREAQILQEMNQNGFPSRIPQFMTGGMGANSPFTDAFNTTTATGNPINTNDNSGSTEPPEIRFQSQLSQLNDMGFFDPEENIRCLLVTNGNVSAAVEILLRNNFPTQ